MKPRILANPKTSSSQKDAPRSDINSMLFNLLLTITKFT
jgi:hypothetical protein